MELKKRGKKGLYTARFWVDGREYKRGTGVTNKELAKKIAERERNAIVAGKKLPPNRGSKLTLQELRDLDVKRCENQLALKGEAYLSLATDKGRWQPALEFFGPKRTLASITEQDWIDFFAWYARTPRKKTSRPPEIATRNRMRALLHRAFAEHVDGTNPIDAIVLAVERPKKERLAARHHLFTEDEWKKLCSECDDRKVVLAFTLCFWCGFRLGVVGRTERLDGEVRGLPWTWIDLETGWLTIPPGHTAGNKGTPSGIAIPGPALDALRAWRAEHPDDEEVLDVQSDTLTSSFARWRKKLKLKGSFHATRHTALTRYGAAGAGEYELQMIGGHMTREMLQVYLHPHQERLTKLAKKVAPKRKPKPRV